MLNLRRRSGIVGQSSELRPERGYLRLQIGNGWERGRWRQNGWWGEVGPIKLPSIFDARLRCHFDPDKSRIEHGRYISVCTQQFGHEPVLDACVGLHIVVTI